jgi:hypothetical protein
MNTLRQIAREGESRAGHADDEIELVLAQTADEFQRLVLIFERAFLH